MAMDKTPLNFLVLACAALGATSRMADAKGLVVHEWGTFTTVSTSTGQPLGGLYVDATRLPGFVQGLPYFNHDAAAGWAPLTKLRNVTVKMETPVLYFYSPESLDVDVKVDFKGGTISQWYPHAYRTETNPEGSFVDFAEKPYAGHIAWKAKVLAPNANPAYSTAASGQETLEWTAPRQVASNMLRGEKGEYERFLFYRGLGNFPNTVKLIFYGDSAFKVINEGDEDIPWMLVYQHEGNESAPEMIRFQGPLKANTGVSLKLTPPPATALSEAWQARDSLAAHLVQAGLNADEARAMLNTWYNSYFFENGLKAFWILPRAMVDRILPLSITPAPEKTERVIVGRSEVLTPAFERELRRARQADTLDHFSHDKYYRVYQDFLANDGGPGGVGLRPPLRSAGNPAASPTAPGLRFRWQGPGPRDALGRSAP